MLKSLFNIFVGTLTMLVLSVCAAFSSQALELDTYAPTSRMAEGKWVKIQIQEEGMQFLSNEDLKKMGFNSPEQVHVYGYGGYRQNEALNSSYVDDLPLQPCVRTQEGLMFYGVGTVKWLLTGRSVTHQQNPYSAESYYFVSDAPLREGESEKAPEISQVYGSDDKLVNTYTHYLLHESEISAAANTGSDLFGEDFRVTNQRTFNFELPGAVNDEVDFFVTFASKTGGGSTVDLTSGDESLAKMSIEGFTDSDVHVKVSSKRFKATQREAGKASLTITHTASGVVYKAFLDFIECSYERALALTDEPLQFCYNVQQGSNPV